MKMLIIAVFFVVAFTALNIRTVESVDCSQSGYSLDETLSMGIFENHIWQYTNKHSFAIYPYYRMKYLFGKDQRIYLVNGNATTAEVRLPNLWKDGTFQTSVSNDPSLQNIHLAAQKSDYNRPFIVVHMVDKLKHRVMLQDINEERVFDFSSLTEDLSENANIVPIWSTDTQSDTSAGQSHLNYLMLAMQNKKTLVYTSFLLKEKPLGQLCFHVKSYNTRIRLQHSDDNEDCGSTFEMFSSIRFGFIVDNYVFLISSNNSNAYFFDVSVFFNRNLEKQFATKPSAQLFICGQVPDQAEEYVTTPPQIDSDQKRITKPNIAIIPEGQSEGKSSILMILGILSAITILVVIGVVIYGSFWLYPKQKLKKQQQTTSTIQDSTDAPLSSQLSSDSSMETPTTMTQKSKFGASTGRTLTSKSSISSEKRQSLIAKSKASSLGRKSSSSPSKRNMRSMSSG